MKSQRRQARTRCRPHSTLDLAVGHRRFEKPDPSSWGASAGGLDALTRLIAKLAPRLFEPGFIVQHMPAESSRALGRGGLKRLQPIPRNIKRMRAWWKTCCPSAASKVDHDHFRQRCRWAALPRWQEVTTSFPFSPAGPTPFHTRPRRPRSGAPSPRPGRPRRVSFARRRCTRPPHAAAPPKAHRCLRG